MSAQAHGWATATLLLVSTEPRDDLPVDPDVLRRPSRGGHHRRWDVALVIAAGGALGGTMRHGVSVVLDERFEGFPWGTFVANVTGALALAVLMVYLLEVWRPGRYLRPFLGVGVLGGFTTFSTYMNETRVLLQGGQPLVAFAYVGATLLVGLLLTWAGLRLTRRAVGASA